RVISDLNDRLGRQWDCKVKVAVSIHAGRAVVGEINSSDPPAVMALGEAMDGAKQLGRVGAAQNKAIGIFEPSYTEAGLDPVSKDKVTLPGADAPISGFLSASAPQLPAEWTRLSAMQRRRAMLQRLWTGSSPH